MVVPIEIAPALWRWAGPHPQWRAGEFGREVASFAMRVRGANALLVDPLLPADPAEVLAVLDRMASGEAAIDVFITIPYHVRSALEIVDRYGSGRVRVWGERRAAERLGPQVEVRIPEPGDELPFGGHCFEIGRPRRAELPLWIEDHAAIAFGDALVTVAGELRVWSQDELDEKRLAFYRERFVPTLAPLLELPARRVLVGHGEPVLVDGAGALRRALAAPPWYHHG